MNAIDIREQNQALQLTVRKFTDEEQTTFDESQVGRYRPPQTRYGFVGRDLDILQIEKHLLSKRNILLVRGMGGAGKTTLLHRLGAWWQAIGFVDRVFYFGYDERAWTCQRIMSTIARRLLSADEYAERFESFSLKDQQTMLAERLRDLRHLLILDNLESITGANLAIQNTLPPREQAALRRFLADLVGGKTLVLLGSRSGEEWLMEEESTISEGRDRASPLQQDEVYELPGLDPEAASILADRILEQHQATQYRDHPDVQKLLTLLGGYPLPLEVVLADLACQTPVEVLKVLEASGVGVDSSDSVERTERILRCVEYSHGNLSSEAQGLLTCLAPFTSVIWQDILEPYTEKLREQPTLAHLPFDRWTEVLQEGARWGLLSSHPDTPSFLCLQPIFTYFLCNRLSGPEGAEVKQAVEVAFRQLYDELTHEMAEMLLSNEVKKKQLGQTVMTLEYENLTAALNLALKAQVSILNPYKALSLYLDSTRDGQRGLELGETILARLAGYSDDKLAGPLGAEFVSVIDNIGKRQLALKQYPAAEASYRKALTIWLN